MKFVHKPKTKYALCGVYLDATKRQAENTFEVSCPTCKIIIFNETGKSLTGFNRTNALNNINLGVKYAKKCL